MSIERRLSHRIRGSKGAAMPEITPPNNGDNSGLSDNAAGAIAYVTFIPAIVFLLIEPFNKNPYVRYHAWQSLFLNVAVLVFNAALGLVLAPMLFFSPALHFAFWRLIELAWLLLLIVCVIQAAKGQRFKLPVIGALAERQAGN
jgi:uncharacterized membrane protein